MAKKKDDTSGEEQDQDYLRRVREAEEKLAAETAAAAQIPDTPEGA